MREVIGLEDLNYQLWRAIVSLYREGPLSHFYLLYDLLYELDRIALLLEVWGGVIASYALSWRGWQGLGVHLWGFMEEAVRIMDFDRRMTIHVYLPHQLKRVLQLVESHGKVKVKRFIDMVADEEFFNPCNMELASPLREKHLSVFMEIKREQGCILSSAAARHMLLNSKYYGVFVDGRLVSIACCYIRLPEVWLIGDVYTHPDYRGRGFAKAVVSAVTRDAIQSGARALLHVEEGNKPAISVYRSLGYCPVKIRPWIFYEPQR